MRHKTLSIAACALASWLFGSAAGAQVARVFVSVNGNDGNTCSNVATPCRTFAGGIFQVDDGGEVIVLDTGSYGGTNITKGVTLNVPPGVTAFAAQPFTINASGKNVTMRGLTIKALTPGSGTAISVSSVNRLTIENSVINGWFAGVDINNVGSLVIRDSVFKNITDTGIHVRPYPFGNAYATIVACHFENNGTHAVLAREGGSIWVRDSIFTGNVISLQAFSSTAGVPGEVNVRNSTFVGNQYGPTAAANSGGTSVIRVSGCTVMDNSVGGLFQSTQGVVESYGDNDVRGNASDTVGTITSIAGTRQ